VAYYVQLLGKVRDLPEWKAFMAQGAFKPNTMSGQAFVDWLDRAESFHRVLMREAKLMAPSPNTTVTTAPAPAVNRK
jgi:tripartite-type tricarboxylate transporter receptor subunit TctC